MKDNTGPDAPIEVTLASETMDWLKKRAAELGTTPDALACDLIAESYEETQAHTKGGRR